MNAFFNRLHGRFYLLALFKARFAFFLSSPSFVLLGRDGVLVHYTALTHIAAPHIIKRCGTLMYIYIYSSLTLDVPGFTLSHDARRTHESSTSLYTPYTSRRVV